MGGHIARWNEGSRPPYGRETLYHCAGAAAVLGHQVSSLPLPILRLKNAVVTLITGQYILLSVRILNVVSTSKPK